MLTTAALLYALTARPCLLSAVEWAESRGNWLAVAGTHRGPYQIAERFSRIPWWAGGDWHGALRGYRYGYPGVRGERGRQYAASVLARCNAHVR
jgi:hypothetical protein